MASINDYGKMADQWPSHIRIKLNVNEFAVSSYTALMSGIQALRSYLKLISEYELHIFQILKLVPQRIMDKTI